MASEFGKKLKISVFGESHGAAIGAYIQGLPAGEKIDFEELNFFMSRRAPGKNRLSTARREADIPEFLSGVLNGVIEGTPICAVIKNSDQHSTDYSELSKTPRPGHADLTAYLKWQGAADMRGGGHFSGRLTAPLCVAGGIAKQILARRGIFVGAHLAAVGGVSDESFPLHPDARLFEAIAKKDFPTVSDEAGEKMQAEILAARDALDSVGGVIECAAVGIPAGLGEPMFDGVENRIASAVFGVPAVKGIEFGSGFAGSNSRGSENNDPIICQNGKFETKTNNAGGILGGITNGMPLSFRVAMKPTPSIAREQDTVDLSSGKAAKLSIRGRHDPCIAHRAVPVIEAVAAAVILDMILECK